MQLLNKKIKYSLPPLYSTEDQGDPLVQVKFFTPDSSWCWYVLEFDPKLKIFFGYVCGLENELGYFSLDELESTKGVLGMSVKRDLYFTPINLSEVKKNCS